MLLILIKSVRCKQCPYTKFCVDEIGELEREFMCYLHHPCDDIDDSDLEEWIRTANGMTCLK